MKPRILLINPWIHDFAAFNLWACPLGLLEVAEFLSAYAIDIVYVDCMDSFDSGPYGTGKYRSERIPKPALLKDVPRYFKRYGMSVGAFTHALARALPADIVLMTSVMSYWYPGVQETIRLVKNAAPNTPIILGGIYPTLYPEHAALQSGADRIYAGQVNDGLVRLLEAFGLTLHPIHANRERAKPVLSKEHSFAPLLTSKGCPFRCSYCASNLLAPQFERKTADDVISDIQGLRMQGVQDFAFYDDALLYQADGHIKPLLSSIIDGRIGARFHAPNGLHARFIDDDLAALMKKAGFITIRLSLETINDARQRKTGGKVTQHDFDKAAQALFNAGFLKKHVGAYIMYGLPGQTLEEVEQGIDFLMSRGVQIHLAEFSPIRGTASWDELVQENIIPPDLDPILTNNTVYSFLYSGYDPARVERIKMRVKEYNRQ